MDAVRGVNTRSNLKSNFWYDIAGYTRWMSTLSFMGGLYFVGQAINAAAAGGTLGTSALLSTIGGTIVGGPFLACAAFGLALAAVTVVTSKHSRRLFVEKTFDVQDFQMQRQAALVGKSVEQAINDHETPFKPSKNWVAQVGAPKAALEHAAQAAPELVQATR